MTDVLRELNFNYANVEKGLNQYLARLNFDQSEEVTNLHASSQVNINVLADQKADIARRNRGVLYSKLQIESTETGRLLRKDVKVIKDEVVQCAALIDSLTNHNRLHSDHQV